MLTDDELMGEAMRAADSARRRTAPNPWVGCAIQLSDGMVITGATHPPGGPHAEVDALRAAGPAARGATAAVTLEPCCHQGRTPPCTDALIDAGVARVLVGVADPDEKVSGRGIEQLRASGIEVVTGVRSQDVEAQLAPYLCQRRTGRPFVVLKLAATLDGRIAAADGSSRWITSAEARSDGHRLRAESGAILVGAGSVRADDPELTVRHVDGQDPLRVVLGTAPVGARVHPCLELSGDLGEVLDELGRRGVLQVLVEGGASVAAAFHRAGLVDQYVVYLAPALMGGDDTVPMFRGQGAATIAALWRGTIRSVRMVGPDVRLEITP